MTTQPFEPAAPEPEPIPDSIPDPITETVSGQATAPGRKAARSSQLLVNGVLAIAFAVLIGGVGFAVGRATTPAVGSANPGTNQELQGGIGFPGTQDRTGQVPGDDDLGRRLGQGGLSLQGTVVSMSATSLTLKLADGQAVYVAINSGTGYHRQADASASDVAAGSTVIVNVSGSGPDAQGGGPTAGSVTIVK